MAFLAIWHTILIKTPNSPTKLKDRHLFDSDRGDDVILVARHLRFL